MKKLLALLALLAAPLAAQPVMTTSQGGTGTGTVFTSAAHTDNTGATKYFGLGLGSLALTPTMGLVVEPRYDTGSPTFMNIMGLACASCTVPTRILFGYNGSFSSGSAFRLEWGPGAGSGNETWGVYPDTATGGKTYGGYVQMRDSVIGGSSHYFNADYTSSDCTGRRGVINSGHTTNDCNFVVDSDGDVTYLKNVHYHWPTTGPSPGDCLKGGTAPALNWSSCIAGAGTVTSVDGSGGTTGLTLTGGPITSSGTLTLGGTLGYANGGTNGTSRTGGFNALAPASSVKGDVLVNNGTDWIRLPVGSNNFLLTADSAQTAGVKWAANSAGGGGMTNGSIPYVASSAFVEDNANLNYDGSNHRLSLTGTAPDATLTIGGTGSTPPSAIADTQFHLVAPDTKVARVLIDSFGAATAFTARRTNGTASSQSGVVSGNVIWQGNAFGWTSSSAFSPTAGDIRILGQDTFSSSTNATLISFRTTPAGSTSVVENLQITDKGNIVPGTGALSTSATDGFVFMETTAGVPTGVPTAYTGRSPLVFDTTHNQLYLYNAGWQAINAGGGGGNSTTTGASGGQGAANSGDLYFTNNATTLERYSGSAWAQWGPIYPLTKPPTAVSTTTTTQGSNGGSITAGATSVVVSSSSGFPSTPFLFHVGTEDVKCTNVSGTTWTIVRGYNGTTAATHADGVTYTLLNWEWDNQGTAAVTQITGGGLYFTAPATSGTSIRMYKHLIGNTSTGTLTIGLLPAAASSTNNVMSYGITLKESGTDKRALFYLGVSNQGPLLSLLHCTAGGSACSSSATDITQSFYIGSTQPTWLRVAISGSNYLYSISPDGQNWLQIKSVAKTTQFTTAADEWGIEMNTGQTSTDMAMTLISWVEN